MTQHEIESNMQTGLSCDGESEIPSRVGERRQPYRTLTIWKGTNTFAIIAVVVSSFVLATSTQTGNQSAASPPTDGIPDEVSFNFHVRSILSENCYYCHGPDANHREAELRLDTAEGAASAIQSGAPSDSELIERILSDDPDYVMPPPDSGRTLTERDKKILAKWIEQGAQYEQHWAYSRPTQPQVPTINQTDWPRNQIDKFVLAKLESNGISPSPRAEPHVIIRRLYFDLLGYPPTPAETQAFISDYATVPEESIDRAVDQLLASEHYGERMALPWLDAARYADSNGFQQDGDRMQYPWRDWVVNALNDNMPFDQFTIEQLAGDLLPDPTVDQLIATGFNRNHMLNGEGGAIPEEQRHNTVFDRVDTTATTWLGLTIACAQCHDHKYDPISQKDYYSFFAYFNNVEETGKIDRRLKRFQLAKPLLELATDEQQQTMDGLRKKIQELNSQFKEAEDEIAQLQATWEAEHTDYSKLDIPRNFFLILEISPAERSKQQAKTWRDFFLLKLATGPWNDLAQKRNQLSNRLKALRSKVPTVMVMRDRRALRQTHVLDRGDYESPLEKVEPAVPEVLPGTPNSAPKNRLTLANWIVNPANPLPSRVAVNRYWQVFFGKGLVRTSEDFGVQGELPSHPQLLDWLAIDFVENGWDVKRVHRMIVTSETYLQSSKFRKDLKDIDPENKLLARGARFRLPSALIRDTALRVSGLLNSSVGGRPVYPHQPDGLWKEFSMDKFSYSQSKGPDLYRRSLYTFWRRTVAPPNQFDSANRQTCRVKPSRTNTPLHALILMNDPTYVEAFAKLAETVASDTSLATDDDRLNRLFATAIGRQANPREQTVLQDALKTARQYYNAHQSAALDLIAVGGLDSPDSASHQIDRAAFVCVAQMVMNTDEFVTRE